MAGCSGPCRWLVRLDNAFDLIAQLGGNGATLSDLVRDSAFQMLFDEPVDEGIELLARTRENESSRGRVPIELEAGGQGGDPDLADRGVRSDDEFALRLLEEHIEHSVLFLDLKSGVSLFFSRDEVLLEGFERGFGHLAEFQFIHHGTSVASRRVIGSRR